MRGKPIKVAGSSFLKKVNSSVFLALFWLFGCDFSFAVEASEISPRETKEQISREDSAKQVPVSTENKAPKNVRRFFEVKSIRLLKKEPKDSVGVWSFQPNPTKQYFYPDQFQECLEVNLAVGASIRSKNLSAKAYFYDSENKLLVECPTPSKSGKRSEINHFEFPVILDQSKLNHIYFEIPPKIRDQKWKAVVVFGDGYEVASSTYPAATKDFLLDYPEKSLRDNRSSQDKLRKEIQNPLIEHVVKTGNPEHPQITLFVRLPTGVTKTSDVAGVLALCILAPGVEALRRDLQKEEADGAYYSFLTFANQNNLAVVAWGSRQLWDPSRNYDELERGEARAFEKSFDRVADSWAIGIEELATQINLPRKNFILWGVSGAGQWAMRLCLRKPQYFLAINIHCASSYDKPTYEARNVLWCVTTGELEAGYERSIRFFKEYRDLGCPIIYKAIPRLGHSVNPQSFAIGFEFMKFALTQSAASGGRDVSATSRVGSEELKVGSEALPRLKSYRDPPFYGDYLNQEVFSAAEVEMIPPALRVALPTAAFAEVWKDVD